METPVETPVETPAEPVEVDGITTHSVETDLAALDKERDLEEVESQESKEPEPEAAAEEPKEEAKPPKKSRSQRRIERLAQENKDLKAQLETKAVTPPAEEPKEIDINDYEDYDAYEAAVKAAETQEPSEVETPSSPEQTTPTAKEGDILDLLEEGKDAYEDFTELVKAEDLALTEDILDYVLETDNGTDITYYLATHKEETLDIAQMSPAARVKALAKIEIKLENKPPKTVRTTQAPKPITPSSGASPKVKSLNDEGLSFEEHYELLMLQKTQSPGGFL